jgi:hypothetical protein
MIDMIPRFLCVQREKDTLRCASFRPFRLLLFPGDASKKQQGAAWSPGLPIFDTSNAGESECVSTPLASNGALSSDHPYG